MKESILIKETIERVLGENIQIVTDDAYEIQFGRDSLQAFNKKFDSEYQFRAYLRGMVDALLINAMREQRNDMEREADAKKRAARRERTSEFNPWKFCGTDKLHPIFFGCYMHDGKLAVSDSRVLLEMPWQYDESHEGKIVDIDLNEIQGVFPPYERMYPDINDEENGFNRTELAHDWSEIASFAKTSKKAYRSNIEMYLNIDGFILSFGNAEKLSLYLKRYGDAEVYVSEKKKMLYLQTEDTRLLIMGVFIELDDESVKERIADGTMVIMN